MVDGKRFFCVITGSNYMSKALALYDSLKMHLDDFILYYFAFDKITYDCLIKMNLDFIVPISVFDIETVELLKVKKERTIPEYFFTLTPVIIAHILSNYKVPHCIYLDADIYFFNSPDILLNELLQDAVMLTKHNYDPSIYIDEPSGKYCVQFMPFINDLDGKRMIKWWKEACIEWCFTREEDGKYADQGYLNNWTERFPRVHILNHLGGGIAPWNVNMYETSIIENKWICKNIKTGNSFDLIFYHFQSLKYFDNGSVVFADMNFNESAIKNIYIPYLRKLEEKTNLIKQFDSSFDPLGTIKINRFKTDSFTIKKAIKIISKLFINKNKKSKFNIATLLNKELGKK